ncbi:MAG TPA: hypothetical protein VFM55_24020 [Micromonosporaceae bacterium]|nr:hypothetical protein [Micromonosporaceae bacterium]
MGDFDEPAGPGLGERFGALHRGLETMVPLPPAEQLVARGRRRRQTTRAVLAGLAVVATVGAGFLVAGPLRPGGPAVVHLADGSREPTHASPGAPAYAPPAGSVRQPVGATVPPGFLPEKGLVSTGASGPPPQCHSPNPPASNAEVIAARSVSEYDGAGILLLVYSDGPTAGRVLDGFRAEAASCADGTYDGFAWRKTIVELDFGGSAVKVTTRYTYRREGSLPPAVTEVVLRYGAALLVVRGVDPAAVDRGWQRLHDRLCVFARDCRPRGGRPAALPQLTAGGPAWAVVLATDSDGDPAKLGRAVAYASELGYRTSITSMDCDAGVREGLGLPARTPYRHVAVYFASRQEADAFTAAARQAPVATVEVRTYCTG